MLQAIRDGSKGIVAKIIVGLIILTFALFGIESIVALGGGEDAPAEVNGEEITEFKVGQMVELQKRRLQSQFGENFDPSMFNDNLLRKSAVEGLINEALLKQAAQDTGIYFSDAEIDKIILQAPEFQTNGQFDRDRYDLVLRGAGFTRISYREVLRTSLATQQAQVAWQHSAFSTTSEQKRVADLEAQTRDFSVLEFDLADAKKEIALTDEEIQAYYDENTERFMTQESLKVDYLELKRGDVASSVEVLEDEIAQRHEDMKAEAASKKEYRAAHILLLAADEAAQAKMADIKQQLAGGAKFEELAKEFSEDDTSKFAGGDLGFAPSDVFEDEFAQALEGLADGAVSDVVETRDGLHLIKLLETRQPEVASLTELQDSIKEELANEKSQLVYLEALETLKDQSFAGEGLDSAAQALSLTIQTSNTFTRVGGDPLAANRQVVEAAFSEAVLFDSENSSVIELDENRAVVLRLNTYNESVAKPLAEVKADIEKTLENDKALELLATKVDAALADAEADKLTAGWKSYTGKSRNNTELESAIMGTVFTMAEVEGGSYTTVNLASGNKALLRLDAVKRDAAVLDNAEAMEQKVSRAKSFNEYKAYYQNFADQSDVVRN